MKEYEISLSNGREFYRNDEGSCWLDGEYETNHDIVISELSEEIIRLLVEKKRMRAENKEYKGKYERFYSRFCKANSKLYDSNTDNERLKRENEQLRQAIADARHLASYHGTTEDIYNRLIEVDPIHQTLKYLKEIEKED
ncbi:hypothetical protein [Bacillus haynesii]|uniref:hypothetical protein n=1 Tax=Bacillus haynesii TaxID=1925021 RepID=UPI00228185B3|nr:hypothetical protein [Bacillus haynesii]MCY8408990.1 hypothetical protein [Bacillus haynesii]MCY8433461.1 hypothetical protein [Bacillus haynesii]MCY8557859.1 hypothetical protein [Bacillus haynesii]MEC0709611.1 hypothetical protein [Bacillus haynesii]MEC0738765.1 hypothetical protein [Bacillus haynesii]